LSDGRARRYIDAMTAHHMDDARIVLNADTGTTGSIEDFVERFRTIWQHPLEHLDHFLDFLGPEVRLTAPLVGTTVGREAGYRAFRDAFKVLPDLRGEVLGWARHHGCLFIEMTFHATVAGRPTAWRNIDRFTFENGLAVERRAFFDPLPLIAAFARRPSGWRQLWHLATQARAM
jgi:hypothetical protein